MARPTIHSGLLRTDSDGRLRPGKEFSLLKRKGHSTVIRGQWPPQRPQIIIIGTKALEGFVHHQTSSKPVEHQLRLFFGAHPPSAA